MVVEKERFQKAQELYFGGLSEAKTAKEIQVNPKTIERWKNKYNWKEEKKKAQSKIKEKIDMNVIEKLADKYEKSALFFLDSASISGKITSDMMQKEYKKNQETKKYNLSKIEKIMKTGERGANMLSKISLPVGEGIVEKLLERKIEDE